MVLQFLSELSANKITWGVASFVVATGSRFVMGELTPKQQELLRNPVIKRIVIFCILYMPTRDLLLAACLTVVACALLEHVLNEQSPYCALPGCSKKREESPHPTPISTTNSTLPIGLRAPMIGPTTYASHMAHRTHQTHQTPTRNTTELEDLFATI